MTPERLAQMEAHFKNPPSASCNSEWALELIAEVRRLTSADAERERHPLMVAEFPNTLATLGDDHAKHVAAHAELRASVLTPDERAEEARIGAEKIREHLALTPEAAVTPPAAPAAKRKASK